MKIHKSNPKKFERMREKFEKEEYEDIFVLADFDQTMTYGQAEGEMAPALTSELQTKEYLNEGYSKKAEDLYGKYQPVVVDSQVPLEKKKKVLTKWRRKKAQLFIENGLSKENLRRGVSSSRIELRDGVPKFLDFLKEKEIPLVIISASGSGPAIPMFFERIGRDYENIHYIINNFKWDKEGKAVAATKPFIHFLNKDEIVLSDFEDIYEKIKDRKDVLLMGDSTDDIAMIEGYDYRLLLKVGLLCYEITEERRKEYKQNFDVVLEGDEGLEFFNEELFNI